MKKMNLKSKDVAEGIDGDKGPKTARTDKKIGLRKVNYNLLKLKKGSKEITPVKSTSPRQNPKTNEEQAQGHHLENLDLSSLFHKEQELYSAQARGDLLLQIKSRNAELKKMIQVELKKFWHQHSQRTIQGKRQLEDFYLCCKLMIQ